MTQGIREYEIFTTRLFEFPPAQSIYKVMHSTKQSKSHVASYYDIWKKPDYFEPIIYQESKQWSHHP